MTPEEELKLEAERLRAETEFFFPAAALGEVRNRRKSMTPDEELKAEVERLRAENEALKKGGRGTISFKVSEKGAVSVYGLGRFPVTLYKEQWGRLMEAREELLAFIAENEPKLKTRGS